MIEEFTIAGYVGKFSFNGTNQGNVSQDEVFLQKMKDCGFNVITTLNASENHAADITFLGFNQILYLLQRLKKIEGLRAFILDTEVWGNDPLEGDYYSHLQKYLDMSAGLRDLIYAYQVSDEPNLDHVDNVIEKTVILLEFDTRKTAFFNLLPRAWNPDDSSYGFFTWEIYIENYLTPYFDFIQSDFDNVQDRQKPYFISYDYYPFNVADSSNFPNTYFQNVNGFNAIERVSPNPVITDRYLPVTYFKHLTVFAGLVKEKRDQGINVILLIFCQSSQYFTGANLVGTGQHGGGDFPFPTPEKLRYQGYSALCHGARGIYWYTYALHWAGYVMPYWPGAINTIHTDDEVYLNAATNNSEIYNALALVNDEMKWIGKALISLEWQETVHGTDESGNDPESEEPISGVFLYTDSDSVEHYMKTLGNSDSIADLIDNTSLPSTLMISHFQHRPTKQNYLLLFNKSGAGQCYQRYGFLADGTATLEDGTTIARPEDFVTSGGQLIKQYDDVVVGPIENLSLVLKGKYIIRRKKKNGTGWEIFPSSYETGSDQTTCNISLGLCEGMLISLATQATS